MGTTEPTEPTEPTAPARAPRTVAIRRSILLLTCLLGALLCVGLGFSLAHLTAGGPRVPGVNAKSYYEGYNYEALSSLAANANASPNANANGQSAAPDPAAAKNYCYQSDDVNQSATDQLSWILGCEDFLTHHPADPH